MLKARSFGARLGKSLEMPAAVGSLLEHWGRYGAVFTYTIRDTACVPQHSGPPAASMFFHGWCVKLQNKRYASAAPTGVPSVPLGAWSMVGLAGDAVATSTTSILPLSHPTTTCVPTTGQVTDTTSSSGDKGATR